MCHITFTRTAYIEIGKCDSDKIHSNIKETSQYVLYLHAIENEKQPFKREIIRLNCGE